MSSSHPKAPSTFSTELPQLVPWPEPPPHVSGFLPQYSSSASSRPHIGAAFLHPLGFLPYQEHPNASNCYIVLEYLLCSSFSQGSDNLASNLTLWMLGVPTPGVMWWTSWMDITSKNEPKNSHTLRLSNVRPSNKGSDPQICPLPLKFITVHTWNLLSLVLPIYSSFLSEAGEAPTPIFLPPFFSRYDAFSEVGSRAIRPHSNTRGIHPLSVSDPKQLQLCFFTESYCLILSTGGNPNLINSNSRREKCPFLGLLSILEKDTTLAWHDVARVAMCGRIWMCENKSGGEHNSGIYTLQ